MTTLQEAAQAAMKYIRSTADYKAGHPVAIEAAEDLSDALAQQGEQQPVAWYEYNQDLDAWFLAYGYNPKAKTRPLVFGDTAAPAPQAQEPCPNGEPCKHGAWCTEVYCQELCEFRNQPAPQAQELRGSWALDEISLSAPAPQPAQDVPEVGFGNMPTKFLANGTRFKLSFDTRGKVSSLWNFMDELDGRWVALVAAEDDCHLQSAQPVAQPLAKTCDTCAHYQQGKHPGVRIHDETCYECRSYWGNKWEAKSD